MSMMPFPQCQIMFLNKCVYYVGKRFLSRIFCIVPILEAFSDLDHCVVNWSEKKEYVKLENERQKNDDVNDNLNLLVLFDTNAANGTFKLGSQNKSVGKLCMKYYYRAAIKEENRER